MLQIGAVIVDRMKNTIWFRVWTAYIAIAHRECTRPLTLSAYFATTTRKHTHTHTNQSPSRSLGYKVKSNGKDHEDLRLNRTFSQCVGSHSVYDLFAAPLGPQADITGTTLWLGAVAHVQNVFTIYWSIYMFLCQPQSLRSKHLYNIHGINGPLISC